MTNAGDRAVSNTPPHPANGTQSKRRKAYNRSMSDTTSKLLGERVSQGADQAVSRTGNDLPLKVVGIGASLIAMVLIFVPQVSINHDLGQRSGG